MCLCLWCMSVFRCLCVCGACACVCVCTVCTCVCVWFLCMCPCLCVCVCEGPHPVFILTEKRYLFGMGTRDFHFALLFS